MKMTTVQQAAMHKLEKRGPVVILWRVTANALIDRGLVKNARQMAHDEVGQAVCLTDKGKRWLRSGGVVVARGR